MTVTLKLQVSMIAVTTKANDEANDDLSLIEFLMHWGQFDDE